MTLELGRLFLLGFRGERLKPDHWLCQALQQHLGGVVLFDRNVDASVQNISSPEQLKGLTRDLQDAAGGGLIIGIDQEGGQVCRLKPAAGFPPQPGAKEVATAGLAASRAAAERCAALLADCGITCNFAPVVDLDCDPPCPVIGGLGRSFGTDAETVAAHAALWVRALHAQGIACCLKHFPGHGRARGDTHLGFVDAGSGWREDELAPYERLIAAGFQDAVMSAHLVLRQLDPAGRPATLSRPILQGLLRERLGFRGVICTDDLQMGAIANEYGYRQAVQQALLAGADLLLVGNNLRDQPEALTAGVAAIEELLQEGRITEARLTASIARVERLARGPLADRARNSAA